MKYLALMAFAFSLSSCASTLISHRMKAAQRKLLETQRLQHAGQWDEARAMSVRLYASVSKSIESRPVQPGAGGTTVDLRPLLTAWGKGPYAELQMALTKRDKAGATAALTSLRQQCVNCHVVLGKTQILIPEIR